MRSSHSLDRLNPGFDVDRLVADAGLLLLATFAHHLGLKQLVERHLDAVSREILGRAWAAGAGPAAKPFTIDLDAMICETYGLLPDDEGSLQHHDPPAPLGPALIEAIPEAACSRSRPIQEFARATPRIRSLDGRPPKMSGCHFIGMGRSGQS